MKIIAYYLPQYHVIKENNEWWGDNFTEWSNVKKGKPLFHGHAQPKIPLEGYYDLMEKQTMMRQSYLMNEYGIYGMAFYHYWFNGKTLLEKPAENLLSWKDVPMNFMFFWANHNWNRSWNGSTEVLQKQTYGGITDWIKHFEYMLPFFKDERYLKQNNKPMIGIYLSNEIPELDAMLDCWNELARKNGFDGVYAIESVFKKKYSSTYKNVNALVLRQPNMAQMKYVKFYNLSKKLPKLQRFMPNCYPLKLDYAAVKEEQLKISKKFKTDKDLILGDFVGWDNTARHGRRGYIIKGQTPKLFARYFERMVNICSDRMVDYLFINAWNEWGEGMYLEPDYNDGFKYLESLKQEREDV